MKKFSCASIQMVSSGDVNANLLEAGRLIEKAAHEGASLVVLPENFALMGETDTAKLAIAEPEGQGPIQAFLAQTAKDTGVWIIGGTVPLQAEGGKVYASCLVIDNQGKQVARYDKIHLFDVDVPGTNEQYRESNTIAAGANSLVVSTPFGMLGVAICYDLRFPELFRSMSRNGLDLLAIPAAFTAKTGHAHWDVLIRARSIENLCYTIASNQGGRHSNGRETYGHSMIVDPWGNVLNSQAQGAGVVLAEIDTDQIKRTRDVFPVLLHRRLSAC